jgi:hypothetical protein
MRKIKGESMSVAAFASAVGANDCMNRGFCFHASDRYFPPYPYFCKVSTNMFSWVFPPGHLTCQTSATKPETTVSTTKLWHLPRDDAKQAVRTIPVNKVSETFLPVHELA